MSDEETARERRAHRARATAGARERGRRPLVLAVVALLLVAVFAIDAASTATSTATVELGYVVAPALPEVQLHHVVAWQCPGPLPAGTGRSSSAVAVANVTSAPVMATMTTLSIALASAPTKAAKGAAATSGAGKAAPVTGSGVDSGPVATVVTHLVLPPGSQLVEPLATTGPAADAAVSVESSSPGIAVAEAVRTPAGTYASPCAVGSAVAGYVPVGTTYGSGDAHVALFNGGVTPAVADVQVAVGAAVASPAAFQGVVVAPRSLVVLDLGRWVPQRAVLAVSVRTSEGELSVGALEASVARFEVATSPGAGHHLTAVRLTGGALVVAAQAPLRTWSFANPPPTTGGNEQYRVLAPGASAALVEIVPSDPAGASAALSELVPAGATATLATPAAPAGSSWSSIVVRSSRGPVVVARSSVGLGSRGGRGLAVTSGTLGPATDWVLCSTGLPATANRPELSLVLADPTGRPASVDLSALAPSGTATGALAAVTVPAYGRVVVRLPLTVDGSGAYAVVVRSSVPVLAERGWSYGAVTAQSEGGIPIVR